MRGGSSLELLSHFREQLALATLEGERPDERWSHSPINPDLADWMLEALESFLSQEISSLDAALGLTRGRGRPKEPPSAEMLAIAKDVFHGRRLRVRWDELSERHGNRDPKDLRAIRDRYIDDVVEAEAADLVARLSKKSGG